MSTLKRGILRLLTDRRVATCFTPLTAEHVTIFMLHRFRHPERGVDGDDPVVLRSVLAHLRREGYQLLALDDVFDRLRDGAPPLNRAVAFTIDDGYADHAEIAAPAFAAYDCPVTTFVTTGFLDGDVWFWWDRIEYAFQQTTRPALQLEIDGATARYPCGTRAERRSAQASFTEWCKTVPDAVKHDGIARLAAALEVELPAVPPRQYAPMSWNDVRACEKSGMTFGPHTVTHPVLSRTTDEQSQRELTESWQRLQTQAVSPVPVFCYPNGQGDDFGDREIRTLRDLGMKGAVTGLPGHASVRRFHGDPASPFLVRRVNYPGDLPLVVQYVCGLEVLKQRLRREPEHQP